MDRMKKCTIKTFIGIFTAAAITMSGCGLSKIGKQTEASEEIFAMDTVMQIVCYGDRAQEAVEAAVKEIQRLDNMLSVGNENSEISLINKNKSGMVSEETQEMINTSIEVFETSDRAFDITIYPMMELWGFTSGDFRVPSKKEIDETLKCVDSVLISVEAQKEGGANVSIGQGQGLDLGGIAKGFTSNRIMEIFEEYDLTSGYVWLGGNVQCYKTKTDGSLWNCGIKDPHDPENTEAFLGKIKIEDKAVITSGGYERYYTDENTGKTYHHILDPKTGYPAEAGIVSATIVSDDGTLADALSTACYVMGVDKSIEYWKKYGDKFNMILMTEDDRVYVTEPIADNFSSEYEVNIIS